MIKKFETGLIQTLVFFVPTNLALHLFKDQAHVYGITIDYLIPKVYFSDFIVVLLFLLWLSQNVLKLPKLIARTNKYFVIVGLLLATLLVSAQQSHYPIAGYWFLIKLVQMTWLSIYLVHHLKPASIRKVLSFTLLFQSLVGIIQWVQKESLLGYYFLGETTLRTTSHIAKTGVTGEIRPLPYGTTPHPNVLAGFLAIGVLILIILFRNAPVQKPIAPWKLALWWLARSFFFLIVISCLLLTQSVSAVIVLLVGLALLKVSRLHWRNALAIVAIFLAFGLAVSPYVESTSVTRRVQLAEISLKMIQTEPWLGVGLDNFTARMTEFGQVISTTRFLQPVHNVYLLWISETGLVSTALLLLLIFQISISLKGPIDKTQGKKTKTKKKTPNSAYGWYIPLLAIAIVGLADHYPLSLQTGQLLSVLAIALASHSKPLTTDQ